MTGRNNSSDRYYDFSDNDLITNGNGLDAANWWREHDEFSNAGDWEENELTTDESDAVDWWTNEGYHDAKALYETPITGMEPHLYDAISDLTNAINKFELKKGMTVHRATSFLIFGAESKGQKLSVDEVKNFIKTNTDKGLMQIDGFMSFTTRPNGVAVAARGAVIDLDVPPNKGMGAYVSGVGGNYTEREYLTNRNAILRFDANSVRQDDHGLIHVKARLMGRAERQTIDPQNTSKFKKKKSTNS